MADITFERPEQMSPLARFLAHSWRPLAALVIVAVLAAAGYAVYTSSAKKAQAKAENDLGAIIATQTGPERLAALEAYVKTAPATTKGAALLEMARTAQEQRVFDKAADAWNQLSLIGPDGMREIAVMGHATALAQGGDKAKAVKLLSDFLPKAPKAMQPIVARQLAAVAEEAQAWNEALAAYERMRDAGSGGNKAFYESKIDEIKSKMK